MLNEKNIVLGISGSIAAYKAATLARLFVGARADVWPILTSSGERFLGAVTLSALTKHRTITDMWSAAQAGEISHVEIAHQADVLVLAPATADLIARLAHGRAHDPLSAVALATKAPWVVAPAMETGMWENPATQRNVATLKAKGAHIVMPEMGELASGAHGVGRMADPETIYAAVLRILGKQDFAGEQLLITGGPTREYFDSVRFITNASSGKMGLAIARMAAKRGAFVRLVLGPTHLDLSKDPDLDVTHVQTTDQMFAACKQYLEQSTVLIMAAAPADYRPKASADIPNKQPKPFKGFSCELEPTPDILRSLKARTKKRIVVGFAAETHDLFEKARAKLRAKDLDFIVANDVGRKDAGFAVDTNQVELFFENNTHETTACMAKEKIADVILDRVIALRRKH